MPKTSTSTKRIKLKIEDNHSDFKSFYDTNKPLIFKKIIECFDILIKNSNIKNIKLLIIGKISGFDWDTEFNFHKNDQETLLRDVLPFFEQIEDYETCSEIINLHKELVK